MKYFLTHQKWRYSLIYLLEVLKPFHSHLDLKSTQNWFFCVSPLAPRPSWHFAVNKKLTVPPLFGSTTFVVSSVSMYMCLFLGCYVQLSIFLYLHSTTVDLIIVVFIISFDTSRVNPPKWAMFFENMFFCSWLSTFYINGGICLWFFQTK